MYGPRAMSDSCLAASEQFPVILLTGSRQFVRRGFRQARNPLKSRGFRERPHGDSNPGLQDENLIS
jgi:hypothetical protein